MLFLRLETIDFSGHWRGLRLTGGVLRLACVLLSGLAWLACADASAQIRLGITLEHRSYMVGEVCAAKIVIQNQINTPLVFADVYHNAELFVELVSDGSIDLPEAARRSVSRDLVIMPGGEATELVEISSLFDLKKPGGYRLRAMLRYEDSLFRSNPIAFDLVTGVEILSVKRSLSGYYDIELDYSLRYWRRSDSVHAFLVVRDSSSGSIYGTFFLGPILPVNAPAIRFDEKGRAVVVHQSGRNRYTRSVIDVDRNGASFVAQTQHLPDGRPYPQTIQKK